MNIKLIILQEPRNDSSLLKKMEDICNELEKVTKKPVDTIYDIESIIFDKEDISTYYLLFCFTPQDYKGIVANSHKMILMNAIYPNLGGIMRDFNFGGIVCYQHFIQDFPMIFGLKSVIKTIDDRSNHSPLIKSEKYESFFRQNHTTMNVLWEYLSLYDAYRSKHRDYPE